MGAGMGLMMMSLNTHMLNSAPRELTGRVTALSQALQNVVSSLAIATFATVLSSRLPLHVAAATAAAGGRPSAAALADASAAGFDNVYMVAFGLIVCAWLLGWTLRRPAAATPALDAAVAPAIEEREPVVAAHF